MTNKVLALLRTARNKGQLSSIAPSSPVFNHEGAKEDRYIEAQCLQKDLRRDMEQARIHDEKSEKKLLSTHYPRLLSKLRFQKSHLLDVKIAKSIEEEEDQKFPTRQVILLLQLKDFVGRMERDKWAYEAWIEEIRLKSERRELQVYETWFKEMLESGSGKRAFKFDWPLKEEFHLFGMSHVYEELLDTEVMRKGHGDLYLEHRSELERALGYSFVNGHDDIDTVLPRHALFKLGQRFSIKQGKLKDLCKIGLTVMQSMKGDSRMKLMKKRNKIPNADIQNNHDRESEVALRNLGQAMGIPRFIIRRKTGEPMSTKDCEDIFPFQHVPHRKDLRKSNLMSVSVLGVLGALYRDGGIEAVERVLSHNLLFDKS